MISGKTLIAWGYKPGPWFAAAIAAAEQARLSGADEQSIRALVGGLAPAPPPIGSNVASVERHAVELIRPTNVAGTVMPDASGGIESVAPAETPAAGVARSG
jgi:hypothetical protein